MDDSTKKLKKITKYARENGLLSVKMDGIEITLSPNALFHVEHPKDNDEEIESSPEPNLEGDALALWSAPGNIPELEG